MPADGIDLPTAIDTAQRLMTGVFEGYGGNFGNIDYNTPDYDKLMHLEQNVYQFSGAKNWQMLKELTRSIKDGDRIVPFREFRNKAFPILEEYNVRHFQTEYNAAVAGAQMASKWVDFEQHPQALLEYRTQEDERVREAHRQLNRIKRPVDDSFWKTYYPPNGWNCRCTVIRLNEGAASPDKDVLRAIADVTPQKGFGVNLAQKGFVFAENSAYYIGLPDNVQKAHLSMQRQTMKAFAKDNLVGKQFQSPVGEVSVTMNGINKILQQPHDDIFYKNNSLYKLSDLLGSAKWINSASDTKGNVEQMHYLETNIAGRRMFFAIKELRSGEKHLYTIQDNNKLVKKKNG